mgnify:CR=1 FL=1
MRRLVQDATPEEMIEFEDFTFDILEALNANQQLDMLHDLGPKYGLDPEACVRVMFSLPNWAALNSEVYMHTVIPQPDPVGSDHRAHRVALPKARHPLRHAHRSAERAAALGLKRRRGRRHAADAPVNVQLALTRR